jgi:hypothetical protein
VILRSTIRNAGAARGLSERADEQGVFDEGLLDTEEGRIEICRVRVGNLTDR